MDKIFVRGGKSLNGTVSISGAKNAALPIMAATLLTQDVNYIHNVPDLRDVATMAHLLRVLGAKIERDGSTLIIDTTHYNYYEAPYDLVRTMRASIYVLGPLLAKLKKARVSLPGGCAWGPRPVDFHLRGMEKLGATIIVNHGYIEAETEQLKGNEIYFDTSSVGATGNVMMASVLAKGITIIENAAREPEIESLAHCLTSMGADIKGIGTSRLEINGISELKAIDYTIIPDRVEAGTFMVATALTKGEITLTNCNPEHLTAVIDKLQEAGVNITKGENTITIKAENKLKPIDVITSTYPGFPTDMQAQFMTLMSITEGTGSITETIYYDRFMHVSELKRLGADIKLNDNVAVIRGVEKLTGAEVMATDLRASAALILAGLVAEGETLISRIYHIDRGYEHIEEKLSALGADIERIRD